MSIKQLEKYDYMNPSQKQILLEFIKDHPNLMKNTDQVSTEECALWSQLAQNLNDVPGAVTTTWKVWRSTWTEFYLTLKLQVRNCSEIDHLFIELLIKTNNLSFFEEYLTFRNDKTSETSDSVQEFDNSHNLLVNVDADIKFKNKTDQFKDLINSVDQINDNGTNMVLTESTCNEELPINSLGIAHKSPSNYLSNDLNLEEMYENQKSQIEMDIVITNDSQKKLDLVKSNVEIVTQVSEFKRELNNIAPSQNNLQSQNMSKTILNNQTSSSTSTSTLLEKALIKKIIQNDSFKIKYMKEKLKMQRDYHKRKLGLMKELVKVKQRKVKAEEKQATALIRIARSLDRMLQNRRQ